MMPISYKKIDPNTLEVTVITNVTHVSEERRAEIQTRIDHWEEDQADLRKRIDAEKAKIAVLDA
ncbi:MAG: hypothetical protein ACYTEX_23170 [Planctomycetota bacterium]|jgi:hypothetical protein